jgi:hypothetical protein
MLRFSFVVAVKSLSLTHLFFRVHVWVWWWYKQPKAVVVMARMDQEGAHSVCAGDGNDNYPQVPPAASSDLFQVIKMKAIIVLLYMNSNWQLFG